MAKSSEKKEEKSWFKGDLASKLIDVITIGFKTGIEKLQERIYETEQKMLKIFFSAMLMMAGVFFVSVAIILLIAQYLKISLGWSFLIIGLVLLIASLQLKQQVMK